MYLKPGTELENDAPVLVTTFIEGAGTFDSTSGASDANAALAESDPSMRMYAIPGGRVYGLGPVLSKQETARVAKNAATESALRSVNKLENPEERRIGTFVRRVIL
jgi:hypothetical protein